MVGVDARRAALGQRGRAHVPAGHGRQRLVDPVEERALGDLAALEGEQRMGAVLLDDGALLAVEDARISTVYDGGRRQQSAGLELWLPGEEYPRRGSGQVIAGSSLDLEGIQVHVAVFRWRLDGREGVGSYELMLRSDPPVAA